LLIIAVLSFFSLTPSENLPPTKTDEFEKHLNELSKSEMPIIIFLDDIERSDEQSILSTYRLLLLLKTILDKKDLNIKVVVAANPKMFDKILNKDIPNKEEDHINKIFDFTYHIPPYSVEKISDIFDNIFDNI